MNAKPSNKLEDIVDNAFNGDLDGLIADYTNTALGKEVDDIHTVLVRKKATLTYKIIDWIKHRKEYLKGAIASGILAASLKFSAGILYTHYYLYFLKLGELSKPYITTRLEDILKSSDNYLKLIFLIGPLTAISFDYLKNGSYVYRYLKKNSSLNKIINLVSNITTAFIVGTYAFGDYIYVVTPILNHSDFKPLNYSLVSNLILFLSSGAYILKKASRLIFGFFTKPIQVFKEYVGDIKKYSDDELMKDISEFEEVRGKYLLFPFIDVLNAKYEAYKRGLIDFKDVVREISLLSGRIFPRRYRTPQLLAGSLLIPRRSLQIILGKESFSNLSLKFFYQDILEDLLSPLLTEKIRVSKKQTIKKLEKIIAEIKQPGSKLAASLLKAELSDESEDWKEFIQQAMNSEQVVIDTKTPKSYLIRLNDELFVTDVFEGKIARSSEGIGSLVKEFLDLNFAYKAFEEELYPGPYNTVPKPLFLDTLNLNSGRKITLFVIERMIGEPVYKFLENKNSEEIYKVNLNIIEELIKFESVLSQRFYNEKYRWLDEFNPKEYLEDKFFNRIEMIKEKHSLVWSNRSEDRKFTLQDEIISDFLELLFKYYNPKYYIVLHGDPVTSNIIKFVKETKDIYSEFTSFLDFKLMLGPISFDLYSYLEDERNRLPQEQKLQILEESYRVASKKRLFVGSKKDFYKAYFMMKILRDPATATMFLDYALRSNEGLRKQFASKALHFCNSLSIKKVESHALFNLFDDDKEKILKYISRVSPLVELIQQQAQKLYNTQN